MAVLDQYLKKLFEMDGSDLHLTTNLPPHVRVHGKMEALKEAPFSPESLKSQMMEIAPPRKWEKFLAKGDIDFSYEIPNVARFRANYFIDRRGLAAVFRVIPTKILTMDHLGLPKILKKLCFLTKGLVVVTGPTGSGKSTTLASIINHINTVRTDHIVTIEDPIEFVYPDKSCLIHQREVSNHTVDFTTALRAVLREDPDVILVGEMRDRETVQTAIQTAETGHLVFGTLHTTTAASTVDRMIDMFPADGQAQIRSMLSSSLLAVVAQVLCQKVSGGRTAAYELLFSTPAISSMIREGKTFQLPSAIQSGGNMGMRSLNEALLRLVKKKEVHPLEAYVKAVDKDDMTIKLKTLGYQVSETLLDDYIKGNTSF